MDIPKHGHNRHNFCEICRSTFPLSRLCSKKQHIRQQHPEYGLGETSYGACCCSLCASKPVFGSVYEFVKHANRRHRSVIKNARSWDTEPEQEPVKDEPSEFSKEILRQAVTMDAQKRYASTYIRRAIGRTLIEMGTKMLLEANL